MSLFWLKWNEWNKDWICSTESEIIFKSHNKWFCKLFDYTSGQHHNFQIGVGQVEGPPSDIWERGQSRRAKLIQKGPQFPSEWAEMQKIWGGQMLPCPMPPCPPRRCNWATLFLRVGSRIWEGGGGDAHTPKRIAHNHTQNKDIRKMEGGGGDMPLTFPQIRPCYSALNDMKLKEEYIINVIFILIQPLYFYSVLMSMINSAMICLVMYSGNNTECLQSLTNNAVCGYHNCKLSNVINTH